MNYWLYVTKIKPPLGHSICHVSWRYHITILFPLVCFSHSLFLLFSLLLCCHVLLRHVRRNLASACYWRDDSELTFSYHYIFSSDSCLYQVSPIIVLCDNDNKRSLVSIATPLRTGSGILLGNRMVMESIIHILQYSHVKCFHFLG